MSYAHLTAGADDDAVREFDAELEHDPENPVSRGTDALLAMMRNQGRARV